MYRAILLVVFVSQVSCLQLQGQCEKNLTRYGQYNDPLKLNGTWYELSRLPNDIEKGDCPYVIFTPVMVQGEVATVNVTLQEVVDGKLSVRNGQITELTVEGYKVTFSDGLSYPFYFLKTDFTEYGVMYSCMNVNSTTNVTTKSVMAWQLGRGTTLSSAAKNNITAVIHENPDLNNTWKVASHSKQICNGAGTIMTSITVLIFGLFIKKIL